MLDLLLARSLSSFATGFCHPIPPSMYLHVYLTKAPLLLHILPMPLRPLSSRSRLVEPSQPSHPNPLLKANLQASFQVTAAPPPQQLVLPHPTAPVQRLQWPQRRQQRQPTPRRSAHPLVPALPPAPRLRPVLASRLLTPLFRTTALTRRVQTWL